MSSLRDLLHEVVSAAVQHTASQVIKERGQHLLSDLGNVVEAVAEDSARLGASAIVRTEQAFAASLRPPELTQSFVRSLSRQPDPAPTTPFYTARSTASPEDREEEELSEDRARAESALDKLLDAQYHGPARESLRAAPTSHTLQKIRENARHNSQHGRPAAPAPITITQVLKQGKAAGRYPSTQAEVERWTQRLLDAQQLSAQPEFGWQQHNTKPASLLAAHSRSQKFAPQMGQYQPPSAAHFASNNSTRRNFSKKDGKMPNKRFDGFMSEPRRQPRVPFREDVSTPATRTFGERPAAASPVSQEATVQQYTLEDKNIYPCPAGVVIFSAPKLRQEDLPVATPVRPAPETRKLKVE